MKDNGYCQKIDLEFVDWNKYSFNGSNWRFHSVRAHIFLIYHVMSTMLLTDNTFLLIFYLCSCHNICISILVWHNTKLTWAFTYSYRVVTIPSFFWCFPICYLCSIIIIKFDIKQRIHKRPFFAQITGFARSPASSWSPSCWWSGGPAASCSPGSHASPWGKGLTVGIYHKFIGYTKHQILRISGLWHRFNAKYPAYQVKYTINLC